ncbi:MAG: QueT transporter family protein [Clostridia bacterium]|nr:QueT transporter family protein [Clostridia bacterium]
MNKFFTAKKLCRAGVIAALYVALTYVFMPFAYGPLQIRPAEALCILPLFFAEAVPALFIGCMIANLAGGGVADIFLGSLITLLAALCTFAVGKAVKKPVWKVILGGIFPVLFNAILLPFIFMFLSSLGDAPSVAIYFTYFSSLLLTQSVWVYGLGTPVYAFIQKMQKHGFTPLL